MTVKKREKKGQNQVVIQGQKDRKSGQGKDVKNCLGSRKIGSKVDLYVN